MFRVGGRVVRCVFPLAIENLQVFLSSALVREWRDDGILGPATLLCSDDVAGLPREVTGRVPEGSIFLEHDPIWFPNFPFEWPPEMLHEAGRVTLQLARQALGAGFALKDATPYNIMFDGPRPVFLDLLSFEKRDPLEMIWPPYAQFVRTFVYPLIAVRHRGARIDELLLVHRDGLEPERVAQLLGMRRWLPQLLGAVALPALFSRGEGERAAVPARKAREEGEARFVSRKEIRTGPANAAGPSGLRAGVRIHGSRLRVLFFGMDGERNSRCCGAQTVPARECPGCRLQYRAFQLAGRAIRDSCGYRSRSWPGGRAVEVGSRGRAPDSSVGCRSCPAARRVRMGELRVPVISRPGERPLRLCADARSDAPPGCE